MARPGLEHGPPLSDTALCPEHYESFNYCLPEGGSVSLWSPRQNVGEEMVRVLICFKEMCILHQGERLIIAQAKAEMENVWRSAIAEISCVLYLAVEDISQGHLSQIKNLFLTSAYLTTLRSIDELQSNFRQCKSSDERIVNI